MDIEFVKSFAAEALAYDEAKAATNASPSSEAIETEERAERVFFDAISAAAQIALHYRSNATEDQHYSAEENANDTLHENGVDPDCDIGRLAFHRVYVETLKLM